MDNDYKRFQYFIDEVRDAERDRDPASGYRRISKLYEEFGEFNEAYLGVTSSNNPKGITIDDVREEAIDVLIMLLDIHMILAKSFPWFDKNDAVFYLTGGFDAAFDVERSNDASIKLVEFDMTKRLTKLFGELVEYADVSGIIDISPLERVSGDHITFVMSDTFRNRFNNALCSVMKMISHPFTLTGRDDGYVGVDIETAKQEAFDSFKTVFDRKILKWKSGRSVAL